MEKKDYTNGDHSFKNWFKIMWQNKYIQLFLVAFVLLVLEIINYDFVSETLTDAYDDSIFGFIMVLIGALIPLAVSATIAYKAFWQFWMDLLNGNSR